MYYLADVGVPATVVVLELLDTVTNHILTSENKIYVTGAVGLSHPRLKDLSPLAE